MAIQIVREISADVVKRGATRAVNAKQYDFNSRFLNVRIQEDGKDIRVDPTSKVMLNVERPDRQENIFEGTVNEDGTVKIPMTRWMLELTGTLVCDISIINEDPEVAKLTTMQFNIYVEAAAVGDESFTESDEYSVIVDLLNRTSQTLEDVERFKKMCEDGAAEVAEEILGNLHGLSDVFSAVDGAVHVYVSDEMYEPYLKEWGWSCSNDSTREIYRWLYHCMLEGVSVPVRTVDVGGYATSFVTDGKRVGHTEIAEDIIARCGNAGEKIVETIMSDNYVTFLRIPVVQFGIMDESVLYTIAQRVINDNPLLMFPFFPSMADSVAVIKDSGGICQYIYSVVPVMDKCAQAREICWEQIGKIVDTVAGIYDIKPGDSLTVNQKAKVLKVIHDYIVLHGNQEDGQVQAWWLYTPYSVFDRRYAGNCTSHTLAFCAVARLYGIEAINMTGIAYVDRNNDGDYTDYGEKGEHSWVAVRLSDEEYGVYPTDPALWSCIDVYWDEPVHEVQFGLVPDREDVVWKYFLNMSEINIISDNAEKTGHSCRTVDGSTAYNDLPMAAAPSLSMPYNGNEIYTWEE